MAMHEFRLQFALRLLLCSFLAENAATSARPERVRRIASEAAALGVGEIFVTGGVCSTTSVTFLRLCGRRPDDCTDQWDGLYWASPRNSAGIAARSPDIAGQPRQPDA